MPSLNEEDSIGKTLERIPQREFNLLGWETEVLLIDGGSQDRTVELALGRGARVEKSRPGYGRQYKRGFQLAKGEIIATADSDNSYPMEQIPALVKILLEKNLDFISANRLAGLGHGSMRMVNRLGNWGLTFLTNRLFGLKLKDSQSGMWVFRKEALDKIKLESDGMSFSQEIKIEAFKKLRALEVDSSYSKRCGNSKLRVLVDGWGNLCHLFRKRFF